MTVIPQRPTDALRPPRTVVAARIVAGIGAGVAFVLAAIGLVGLFILIAALVEDYGGARSSPGWTDFVTVGAFGASCFVFIAFARVVRAFRAGGPRAHRAWRGGVLASAAVIAAGVAIAVAPWTSKDQPVMPEIAIGAAVVVVGSGMLALFRAPSLRRWIDAR